MSDHSPYKDVKGVTVSCSDCGKPYSRGDAREEESVFRCPEEAREHINRTSTWAAGTRKVICGLCLTRYTTTGARQAKDLRDQLRNEPLTGVS